MADLVNREQFKNAVLGLRRADDLADEALVLYWTANERGDVPSWHVEQVEMRCAQVERRIAAFRMELEAQRSRVAPIPDEARF